MLFVKFWVSVTGRGKFGSIRSASMLRFDSVSFGDGLELDMERPLPVLLDFLLEQGVGPAPPRHSRSRDHTRSRYWSLAFCHTLWFIDIWLCLRSLDILFNLITSLPRLSQALSRQGFANAQQLFRATREQRVPLAFPIWRWKFIFGISVVHLLTFASWQRNGSVWILVWNLINMILWHWLKWCSIAVNRRPHQRSRILRSATQSDSNQYWDRALETPSFAHRNKMTNNIDKELHETHPVEIIPSII